MQNDPNIPVPQFLAAYQEPNGAKQFSWQWSDVGGGYYYYIYRDGVRLYGPVGVNGQMDDQIEYNKQYIYRLSAAHVVGDVEHESVLSVPVVLTASPLGLPFATSSDLGNYWKVQDDPTRSDFLLNLASNRLRAIAANSSVDLDAKAAADPIFRNTLQYVVLEAVKRAMITPNDQPSVESAQITAGPYSQNLKYTNPTGDLFFRKSELSSLGLSGNQRLGSISTTKKDIYLEKPGPQEL